MADNLKFVAGKIYRLSGSGCTAIAASITVNNLVLSNGSGDAVTMAMFGTIGYFTLEPGTSRVEFGSFTGITANGNGTSTLTGCVRGLDFVAPYTNVSTNQRPHAGGTALIFSNSPGFYSNFAVKNNDETITGVWTYEQSAAVPRLSAAHTYIAGEEEYLVTKRYADGLSFSGAPDGSTTQKGVFEEATLAEIIAGTAAGGTGARLTINPSTFGARLYFGYAADAGGSDTYAITCSPAPAAYTTGMVIQFLANTNNTGACTLNVNALGAKSLKVNKDLDPQDLYIKAGQMVTVIYDGTNFQILSVSGKASVSQSGTEIYGADSVGTDAYAITVAPVPTLSQGSTFRVKIGTANTGPATLNVNGTGALAIVKNYNQPLVTGDLVANQIIEVVYDGTNWQLILPTVQPVRYFNTTTTKNAADASTTQNIANGLGVIPKNVRIRAYLVYDNVNDKILIADTVYNGTTQASFSNYVGFAGAIEQTNSFILNAATGPAHTQSGALTFDATNVIITWTKVGSPTGTYILIVEAEG